VNLVKVNELLAVVRDMNLDEYEALLKLLEMARPGPIAAKAKRRTKATKDEVDPFDVFGADSLDETTGELL